MPNYNNTIGWRNISYRDIIPFLPSCCEFVKNADSTNRKAEMFFVLLFSLATIGVCVFCAVTSVAALFIFSNRKEEQK